MRYSMLGLLALAGCDLPEPRRANAPTTRLTTKPAAEVDPLKIDFREWPTVTLKPYPVSAKFDAMCRAPLPSETTEAHGPHYVRYIVVRVNPEAVEDFQAKRPLPVGSVVVKEKHPDAKAAKAPEAYTAMVKREKGYDPEHGDWEYAEVRSRPEKQAVRGRIASCIACHDGKKESDYLFRGYLK